MSLSLESSDLLQHLWDVSWLSWRKKTWTHSLTLPFPKRSCKILQDLTSQAASGGKISDCSLAQVIQKEIALACGSTPSISQHHVLFALFHHLSSIYIYNYIYICFFHYLVFIKMSMWHNVASDTRKASKPAMQYCVTLTVL